jgi:transposase
MRKIVGAEHEQMLLLPACVEEWIGPEHPARFVREFVGTLDLKQLGLDTVGEEGGEAYAPRLLLSAWLYGYQRRVRSTRALERGCAEEMGFIWLTGNRRPDHNTLWRFWHTHRAGVRALFRQSVRVAMELNLIGLVVEAVDGTKIQAACSGRGSYDQKGLEKMLARLDAELGVREASIAQDGAGEERERAQLPAALQERLTLREQVKVALEKVRAGEARHVHPREPEARRMESDGRNRFSYNAQAVINDQAGILVAAEVTTDPIDQNQLAPMLRQARTQTDAPAHTLADNGYVLSDQLAEARVSAQQIIAPPPTNGSDETHPYHASHFKHDPVTRTVTCPQGHRLPYRFTRDKDGRQVEVYRSAQICRDCPVRAQCSPDRHGRLIEIVPHHEELVALRARWADPVLRKLYQRRAALIEPVFARIKQIEGFRRWSARGWENARTQWAMLCTVWNLRILQRHWTGHNPRSSTAIGAKITQMPLLAHAA